MNRCRDSDPEGCQPEQNSGVTQAPLASPEDIEEGPLLGQIPFSGAQVGMWIPLIRIFSPLKDPRHLTN